MKSRKKQNH